MVKALKTLLSLTVSAVTKTTKQGQQGRHRDSIAVPVWPQISLINRMFFNHRDSSDSKTLQLTHVCGHILDRVYVCMCEVLGIPVPAVPAVI